MGLAPATSPLVRADLKLRSCMHNCGDRSWSIVLALFVHIHLCSYFSSTENVLTILMTMTTSDKCFPLQKVSRPVVLFLYPSAVHI